MPWTKYPFFLKCSGIVTMFGSATRKCVTKSHTLVESGRVPVIKLDRDGEQTACCTYARSNAMPIFASRSIFGLLM